MIKRFYLPGLFIFVLLAASCKLDAPDMQGLLPSGDGTGTYQPVTKGSTWTYKETVNSGTPSYETMTITGVQTVINKRTYFAVDDKVGNATNLTYFCHDNGNYYIRSTVLGAGVTVEYLYLKDDIAVGQTWKGPITDSGKLGDAPAQIVGKVTNRDTTMTVGSVTFKNVMRSQLLVQYDLGIGNGFETYQTLDFYAAKGAGIIKIDTKADAFSLASATDLDSYKIEK